MSLTWSSWVTEVANLMELRELITNAALADPTTDTNFNSILPGAVDYAEQRIYRELDFLATRKTDATSVCVSGTRDLTIPATLIVIEELALISPAGSTPGQAGSTRIPLLRSSIEYLDAVFVTASDTGVPEFYAIYDEQVTSPTPSSVKLAPTPNAAYRAEFRGTFRPTPLSASNTSTFLTLNLPDLFVAASMVFMSGYQKNYGSQSGDPQQAQSWEAQYQGLKQGAINEEARKKSGGLGGLTGQVMPGRAA